MSYPGYLLEESYLTAEMQSVYSTAPAKMAVLSMSQIDLFKNYSYLIGPYTKKISYQTTILSKYEYTMNTIF